MTAICVWLLVIALAFAAYTYVGVPRPQKHLGLVASQNYAGFPAARNQHYRLRRLTFVTAREDRRVMARLPQVRREMSDHGRFSNASHGQAAHANHRSS